MFRQVDCSMFVDEIVCDADDWANRGTLRPQRQMAIHETQNAVVPEQERSADCHGGHEVAEYPDPHEGVLHTDSIGSFFGIQ